MLGRSTSSSSTPVTRRPGCRPWRPRRAWSSLVSLLAPGGSDLGSPRSSRFHEWLPEAMAGPGPVSALIHAATMVKSGVYLVARLVPLFYVRVPGRRRSSQEAGCVLLRHGLGRRLHRVFGRHARYSWRWSSRRCSHTRRSARSDTCCSALGVGSGSRTLECCLRGLHRRHVSSRQPRTCSRLACSCARAR